MIALAIVAAALLLIGFTRIGVRGGYTPQGAFLRIKIGWFRLRVLPAKPKKKKKKPPPKPSVKTERKPKKAEKKEKEYTFDDMTAIVRLGLNIGGKFLRGLRVDLLELDFTAGGDDACETALLYGRLHMIAGLALPALHGVFRVKKQRIHIGIDYTLEKSRFYGRGAVTVSIGRLLAVTFSALIGFLRWRMTTKEDKPSAPEERGKAA